MNRAALMLTIITGRRLPSAASACVEPFLRNKVLAKILTGEEHLPPTTKRAFSSSSSPQKTKKLSQKLRSRRLASASEDHDATTKQKTVMNHILQILQVPDGSQVPLKSRKTRKKEKRARQLANTDAVSSTFVPLYDDKTDANPSKQQERELARAGWSEEKWDNNWGKDNLVPKQDSQPDGQVNSLHIESYAEGTNRAIPPHIRSPIPYTRRLEGLLEDTRQPVLEDITSPFEHQPIARLAHGLDRVLFNPGVHWLKDPRSQVYNFPTWLESVPNVADFAFERLTGFVKSSCDEDLWNLAKREERTFTGSTSSLTGILSHIYFLLSGDKPVDVSPLSRHFQHEAKDFTPGQRMPVSVIVKHRDGVYAIDSDSSQPADKNILTWMGTLLEKFVTLSHEEFLGLFRSSPTPVERSEPLREAYRYAKSAKFVMRSQLDCQDRRLPGTGVFDIKTRAALPIRLDLLNYEENSGYLIRTLHGPVESFEKEYYDLIRSAFLKYSFQARIGNMDGVFVAYHNIARLFGFQYISLDEMDERLFGAVGRGGVIFDKCVAILEIIVSEIILPFPNQSVKCTIETLEDENTMNVWIEPDQWDDGLGTKPIVQLDVTATSYLDGKEVRGSRAISGANGLWKIHWTVCKSAASFEEIRCNLSAAKVRQFRAYNLPAGVDLDEMARRWESMNFGGQNIDSLGVLPFDPSLFKEPGRNIETLRAMARAGREETERLAVANEGMEKVVWGSPDVIAEENQRLWQCEDSNINLRLAGSALDADHRLEDGMLAESGQEASIDLLEDLRRTDGALTKPLPNQVLDANASEETAYLPESSARRRYG